MTRTTIVVTNDGRVFDLGAGERVPKSKEVWGINAFTCDKKDVPEIRFNPKKTGYVQVSWSDTVVM